MKRYRISARAKQTFFTSAIILASTFLVAVFGLAIDAHINHANPLSKAAGTGLIVLNSIPYLLYLIVFVQCFQSRARFRHYVPVVISAVLLLGVHVGLAFGYGLALVKFGVVL